MNLHKRDFLRKQFEVESLRPVGQFLLVGGDKKSEGHQYDSARRVGRESDLRQKAARHRTKANPIAPNGVSVTARGCGEVTVWLSPDTVVFNNTLKVVINGENKRNVQPKIDTLLEDVRPAETGSIRIGRRRAGRISGSGGHSPPYGCWASSTNRTPTFLLGPFDPGFRVFCGR